MALSTELLSQFAKVTNDETKSKSDTTVYGTIVEQNGVKYVQIDGSDLLTPISSTTNVEDKERVTVMIKNHMATVTGNISSPAARTAEVESNSESIKRIEADYVKTESLDAQYANIDFANIGTAAMEYFYANSGLIKDVVVGDQTISGELVGVTIRGDRIIGETVIAEKLVIKGEDGLFYKLNTDGMSVETEQTNENSLNGSVITAKSITATKISVTDLVAFDATIGGFKIEDSSIHSIAKDSVDNTTQGLYLGSDGQMALGDANNFLKYYKDTDGTYKLAISADSFVFSSDGKSVADVINGIQIGGTQLIKRTRDFHKDGTVDTWTNSGGVTYSDIEDGFRQATMSTTGKTADNWIWIASSVVPLPVGWQGREVTMSCYIYSPDWTAVDNGVTFSMSLTTGNKTRNRYRSARVISYNSGNPKYGSQVQADRPLSNGVWLRIAQTFTLSEDGLPSGTGTFADNTHMFATYWLVRNGEVRVYAPKLEWGNKATDWSPHENDVYVGANYLLNSGVEVSNAKYAMVDYPLGDPKPTEGETYTLRLWGQLGSDREFFQPYNSSGVLPLSGSMTDNGDGTHSATFTWKNSSSAASVTPTFLRIYQRTNTGTSTSTITRIKLEKGRKATDWTQHPNEFQAGTNVLINKDQFTVTTPEFNVKVPTEDGTDTMLTINKDGLFADHIECANVPQRYDGPTTLYVDSAATSAQIGAKTHFRSLAQLVDVLNNKWTIPAITINIAAGHEESGTITIRGIHGGEWINIYGSSSSHALLRGRINVHYCAVPIRIRYVDIVSTGTGIQLGGRMTMAQISDCIITGPGTSTSGSYGVDVTNGAHARISSLEIYDFYRSFYGQLGGIVTADGCAGNCTVGANKSTLYLTGKMPCASTTWAVSTNAGEVLTGSVSVNQGSKPSTSAVTTTTVSYTANASDTWASGGWNVYGNDDIYQGYTSALGEHRGCFWFDNTTIRSALKSKTIKQVTLSLYQMSGVGRNQPVQVSLEGITVAKGGTQPFGNPEYGVIGTTLGVNQTTTFTIPNKVITDLVAGTINGLMVRTGETAVAKGDDNSVNYARFAGKTTNSNLPKLTITYA